MTADPAIVGPSADEPRDMGRHGHSPMKVGDPVPAVLVLADLARLLGLGHSQANRLERRREFEPFEMLPRIGKRPRYSGKKVQAWLDGEPLPSSGDTSAKPARTYFNSARRR